MLDGVRQRQVAVNADVAPRMAKPTAKSIRAPVAVVPRGLPGLCSLGGDADLPQQTLLAGVELFEQGALRVTAMMRQTLPLR